MDKVIINWVPCSIKVPNEVILEFEKLAHIKRLNPEMTIISDVIVVHGTFRVPVLQHTGTISIGLLDDLRILLPNCTIER